MKYYRIYRSIDIKIIGQDPQVVNGIYPSQFDSPNSLYMYGFKKASQDIELPKAVLNKKAKLIDIIQPSFLSAGQYFISNKLKTIISKYNREGLHFLQSSVIFQSKEIEDYWISNPYKSSFSFLDFEASEFVYTNSMGSVILESIKIRDADHYIEVFDKNKLDAIKIGYPKFTPLAINKIVINENCDLGSFSISGVYGGIGLYVSEIIKQEIEQSDCKGIVFKDPNERYP